MNLSINNFSTTKRRCHSGLKAIFRFALALSVGVSFSSSVSAQTLGQALDNIGLTWTTSGNEKWVSTTEDSYYGGSSAKSGGLMSNNNFSTLTLTVSDPGILKFYWKVSCDNGDWLSVRADGFLIDRISANPTAWAEKTIIISGTGNHTISWTYSKDELFSSGWDRGWVDYVRWIPAAKCTVVLDKNGGTGGTDGTTAFYGEAMPIGLVAPTRTGYTFAGYYDATTGGTQYYSGNMSSVRTWDKVADATLYAQWLGVINIVAKQRYPWNGLVDIEYEVVGDAGLEFSVVASGKDSLASTPIPLQSVTGEGAPGTTVRAGKRKMTWNMTADAPTLKSDNFVLTISVAPPPPLYIVIDLSGGVGANSYSITYLNAVPVGGWTDEYKTTKLVMRRIEAGVFTMGSPSGELGNSGSEYQHQVTLTQAFYIGVFEVTQRQWELVMGTKPSLYYNTSCYTTRPVEQLKYNDIRGSSVGAGWPGNNNVDSDSFMGKLRSKTLLAFDLPTDAQWEYACRAGTTTALNSGKNLTSTSSCSNMAEVGRYLTGGGWTDTTTEFGTNKVGSYLPNAWGLYDMHGNVWEWCLDWYVGNLGTAGVTDPKGAASGSSRLLCGGSWSNDASYCRSANRNNYRAPSYTSNNYGFRTALVPVQ